MRDEQMNVGENIEGCGRQGREMETGLKTNDLRKRKSMSGEQWNDCRGLAAQSLHSELSDPRSPIGALAGLHSCGQTHG